jgi:hypothetical protein
MLKHKLRFYFDFKYLREEIKKMSFVYILTNESMPGYIKIGITERPVTDRVLELDNTSVPIPFQCYYAARVSDHKKVERALHTAFGDSRIRNSREFFSVDPFRVKAVLELMAEEDVTPREEVFESKDAAEALQKAISRGRRFSFSSAGIPIGAQLVFSKSNNLICEVISDTSVKFNDQDLSLSKSALEALHQLGYKWTSVAGTEYWLYNGETLDSIRRAKESIN